MAKNFIRLLEVASDIAGAKLGAKGGIDILKIISDKKNSNYFKKYPLIKIEDENQAALDKPKLKNAKHIEYVYKVLYRVSKQVYSLRKQGFFPIIMAGDHSSAAGTMAGLLNAHEEEIGVIWIDAHTDIHTPYTTPSGNLHGMPLAIATKEDNLECQINSLDKKEQEYWQKLKNLSTRKIDKNNIVYCAIRDYEEAEKHLLNKHDIKYFTTADITYSGIKQITKDILSYLKHCKHLYISFDVDSIDPMFIPGTGTPVEFGLSFEQALLLNLELIKDKRVCCWEMAEINPSLDMQDISGKYSFEILEKLTHELIENY